MPLNIEVPQVIQSRNAFNHSQIIVRWKLNKFFVENQSRIATGVTEKNKANNMPFTDENFGE